MGKLQELASLLEEQADVRHDILHLSFAQPALPRMHWAEHKSRSKDLGVLETAGPFFAFRGLVVASPLWYPDLPMDVRRKIFRFVQSVLAADRFQPEEINRYLRG